MSKCSICAHPQRGEIEKAIVSGVPYRHIASQYGAGYKSINRHAKNHMQIVIAPPIEVPAPIDATKELIDCLGKVKQILGEAEQKEDLRLMLACIAEARQLLDTGSRLAVIVKKTQEEERVTGIEIIWPSTNDIEMKEET